jgi:hypothetical protein
MLGLLKPNQINSALSKTTDAKISSFLHVQPIAQRGFPTALQTMRSSK